MQILPVNLIFYEKSDAPGPVFRSIGHGKGRYRTVTYTYPDSSVAQGRHHIQGNRIWFAVVDIFCNVVSVQVILGTEVVQGVPMQFCTSRCPPGQPLSENKGILQRERIPETPDVCRFSGCGGPGWIVGQKQVSVLQHEALSDVKTPRQRIPHMPSERDVIVFHTRIIPHTDDSEIGADLPHFRIAKQVFSVDDTPDYAGLFRVQKR